MEAELTVTEVIPVELNVRVSDFDVPSATLPKGRVVALSASLGSGGVTPDLSNVTTVEVPVVELLSMVSLPTTAPLITGANVTGMASVCPGASVTGNTSMGIENPAPVMEPAVRVTEEVPAEVRVRVRESFDPSGTSPKLRVDALGCNSAPTGAGRISQMLKLY